MNKDISKSKAEYIFFLFKIYFFLLHVYMCIICMGIVCMAGAQRGQKRSLGSAEQGSLEKQQVLLSTESSF